MLENLSDLEVLSLTIIGEARGEPIEGQVGVGCIIRNRLHLLPSKYKSYSDVCLEPKQFSCWNENDPNRAYLADLGDRMLVGEEVKDPHLRQCMLVAKGVYDWAIVDNTKGSTNYLTGSLFYSEARPSWARSIRTSPITLGKQVFFLT